MAGAAHEWRSWLVAGEAAMMAGAGHAVGRPRAARRAASRVRPRLAAAAGAGAVLLPSGPHTTMTAQEATSNGIDLAICKNANYGFFGNPVVISHNAAHTYVFVAVRRCSRPVTGAIRRRSAIPPRTTSWLASVGTPRGRATWGRLSC